jgi:iron-sulfur cluster repair protein YtfE (RIC family)
MARILDKHIDPIAQLMQEHDEALLKLSMLNKATRSLAENGFSEDAYAKVLLALEFIDEEVTVHNKSEEEALFPVLERYVEGPTELMRKDHQILKKEFVRLRKAVNNVHKENHILFPLVQKFMTKDALREVARRMV